LGYAAKDVHLHSIFDGRGISSVEDLIKSLKVEELIKNSYLSQEESASLRQGLNRVCSFLYDDCRLNHKEDGIIAFNKLKHGLVFIPEGDSYPGISFDNPGAIYNNPNESQRDTLPLVLWGLKVDEENLTAMQKNINFVHLSLRLYVLVYLWFRYKDWLVSLPHQPFSSFSEMLNTYNLIDVRDFLAEIQQEESG